MAWKVGQVVPCYEIEESHTHCSCGVFGEFLARTVPETYFLIGLSYSFLILLISPCDRDEFPGSRRQGCT